MSGARTTCRRALSALGLVAACATAVAADVRTVDYLYVEANEGDSSGGHVALRIGAGAFHFQQEIGGLIRMRRDDAAVFHFRYAMLGNRAIHESRIAVSDDTYRLLGDTFSRRVLVQAAQYGRVDVLQADIALFELWQRRAAGEATAAPVRAAGYFLPDGFSRHTTAVAASPAVAALRDAVATAHGSTFLADRTARVRAGLAAWRPHAVRAPAPRLSFDAYPSFPAAASTDYRERLEALTALEVLATAPALQAGVLRIDRTGAPLDGDEHRALNIFAGQLTVDLAALAASPRTDFGHALLLGMARLAAIEVSLRSGRLAVLDAFADHAPVAPLPDGAGRRAYLDALAEQVRPAAERARGELFAQPRFREADYTELETTANRWLEVERARRDGTPLRAERGVLLPARASVRSELIAPPLPAAEATAELDAARAALADYRGRLGELYRYNLITRNCVSEIFTTIDAALGDASGSRLGGVVRTGTNLNFIPIVSAAAVDSTYGTRGGRTRPSYRQLSLAALAADDPSWRAGLRESNTVTSTVYHPGPRDSAFLFFTDDTVVLRPLLGLANLAVGLGGGAVGLATWPADGGHRLRAGLRGALFSLPELVFVNIRKGSMAWVDPRTVERALQDQGPQGQQGHQGL